MIGVARERILEALGRGRSATVDDLIQELRITRALVRVAVAELWEQGEVRGVGVDRLALGRDPEAPKARK